MGQTHVAISLAIAAAQSGRRVHYGTLADLITTLDSGPQPGSRDLREAGGGGPLDLRQRSMRGALTACCISNLRLGSA
jgi:IstB-like ATP binding protein